MANIDTNTLSHQEGTIFILYQILPKCSLKLISSKCSSFWLTTYVLCLIGGHVFQQTVGIHMGTNCVHLFADLFIHSYNADFIQGLLKKNGKKLAITRSFNFTFRYIDDVLSLNNSRVGDFVDRIYPIEFEIKDTIGLLHIRGSGERNYTVKCVNYHLYIALIYF